MSLHQVTTLSPIRTMGRPNTSANKRNNSIELENQGCDKSNTQNLLQVMQQSPKKAKPGSAPQIIHTSSKETVNFILNLPKEKGE